MQTVNVQVIRDPIFSVQVVGGGGGTGAPGSGTVTSVGLALPAIFSVSGSPVTSSGTLTGTLATQTANTIWAGPTTGAAAAPTFRALVAGDIPNIAQSQVTNLSTDLAAKQPLDSDLTAIASLTPTNDDLLQYKAGAWANRTIAQVKTDLGISGTNTGDQTITLTGDATGSGTGSFAVSVVKLQGRSVASTAPTDLQVLSWNDSGSQWEPRTVSGGGGTVTSVGLALPAIFSVSGSPVTSSGTLTGTLATQTANTIWAGPTTGAAAAPTFRALVSDDIPTLAQSKITNLTTDLAGKQPLDSDLTAIASLTPTNDDLLQYKAGSWANRTVAQVKTDLGLSGTNTGDQTITLTGDVTGSGTGSFAATIAASAVTYAKIQNVSATDRLLGRSTAGAGVIEEITCTAAGRALLDDADAAAQRTTLGLGTLATQSGTFSGTSSGTNTGDQTITLTGDATGSGTGSFAVSVVKLQGRSVASTAPTDLQVLSWNDSGSQWEPRTVSGGGGGTVTSVGLSLPAIFSVSGSPVTSSGTLTGTLATQTANTIWAGPTTGAAAAPTFRALVSDDIPTLAQSKITNLTTDLAGKQPLDSDLTAIAGLSASNDDFLQRKAGSWANRTIAQVKTDLGISGTNTGDQTITLTGDVTGSGTGSFAATIAASAVTYAKIQNVSATDRLLGRSTAGAGVVEEITCTAAGRALLDDADASAQRTTLGLGTLATQSGTFSGTSSGTNTGDQTITLTGDVTGTGTGSFAATIANDAVTFAKMQNINTAKLLGRFSASSGNVEEITISTGLSLDGSGNLTASGGGSTDLAFSGTSSPVTLTSSSGTDVTFTAGSNITLSASSGNITIAASGGGGSSPLVSSPATITADQDDYSPTDWADATTVRLSFDSAMSAITGFASATDGERKTLRNVGTYTGYIPCEHPDSTAANRVAGQHDYFLPPGGALEIEYDGTLSRWAVVSATFQPASGFISGARGHYYQFSVGATNASDSQILGLVGTNATNAGTSTLPGNYEISTAASATGNANINLPKTILNPVVYSSAHIVFSGLVHLPNLSDGTQTYTGQFALIPTPTSTTLAVNNSIGFRYTHSENSGNWTGFTRNNSGTESTVDLGVAVAVNTPYVLTCCVNKANNEARFYINGAYAGRVTTNMPNAVATGLRFGIFKSVGTTARVFSIASGSLFTLYP